MARFATRARFASWNGTAPLDASSGEQQRHRLSRAGNRRINRALHIMAIVQIRHDTEGRAYFLRRVAAGKTKMEALRALKRRLSDVVYRQLVADMKKASPGGHTEAITASSAVDPTPTVDSSDQSQPGLNHQPTQPDAYDHDTRRLNPAAGRGTSTTPGDTRLQDHPHSRSTWHLRSAHETRLDIEGSHESAIRTTRRRRGAVMT